VAKCYASMTIFSVKFYLFEVGGVEGEAALQSISVWYHTYLVRFVFWYELGGVTKK
jgi:hypothetical protein